MKLMNENTWNVYVLIKKQVYYSIVERRTAC